MARKLWPLLAVSALAGIALPEKAHLQETLPDLNGTYRCEADPVRCNETGQVFTISQSGAKFDAKNDKGEVGQGMLTSKITLSLGPPWNTLGVILPDNRTIEWSGGTRWRKE
jgi:hypothetical protein